MLHYTPSAVLLRRLRTAFVVGTVLCSAAAFVYLNQASIPQLRDTAEKWVGTDVGSLHLPDVAVLSAIVEKGREVLPALFSF